MISIRKVPLILYSFGLMTKGELTKDHLFIMQLLQHNELMPLTHEPIHSLLKFIFGPKLRG